MRCTELRSAKQKKEEKRTMLKKVVTNRWSWLTTLKESLASALASYGTRW